jgi:hypothetical protein
MSDPPIIPDSLATQTLVLLNQMWHAVQSQNARTLNDHFGISSAIYAEIVGAVQGVHPDGLTEQRLTVPTLAAIARHTDRPLLDIFERDTPATPDATQTWGLECSLMYLNKVSDLSLQADVYYTEDKQLRLQFNLIEVM